MDPLSSVENLPSGKGVELISGFDGRDKGLEMLMSMGVPESAQEQFQIAMDPYLPDIQREMLSFVQRSRRTGGTDWLSTGKEKFGEWANGFSIVLKRTQEFGLITN